MISFSKKEREERGRHIKINILFFIRTGNNELLLSLFWCTWSCFTNTQLYLFAFNLFQLCEVPPFPLSIALSENRHQNSEWALRP